MSFIRLLQAKQKRIQPLFARPKTRLRAFIGHKRMSAPISSVDANNG